MSKPVRVAAALFVLTVALAAVPAAAQVPAEAGDEAPADVTEVLIRQPAAFRTQAVGTGGWVAVAPAPGETVEQTRDRLAAVLGSDNVAYNYRYEPFFTPNDPSYGSQWNFSAIGTAAAWDRTKGAGVTVAVIDTGISFGGVDLDCHQGKLSNPYNSITHTAGVGAVTDTDGHGTHMTGTLAQCTNNGTGVAGVAFEATIMPIKAGDPTADSLSLAEGINWAVANGADVINVSLGRACSATWPACNDPVVDPAIDAADAAGVVVVVSSGNDNDPFVASPANHPKTIAVGATRNDNAKASYSSYGAALSMVAPGGDSVGGGGGIVQETFGHAGWGLYSYTGTSSAAAHVSGAAALVLSVRPAMSPAQVRNLLANTAVDLGPGGWDPLYGAGLLQVGDAVSAALDPADPCAAAVCDTIYAVNAGGQWTRWDELNVFANKKSFYYGNPGDVGFSGDWNCDGEATPGLYRQSDGFVYLRNSNTQGIADITFFFGNPGDIPVAGDFNDDGCDTVSLYRPSEGRFYVINQLGKNGGGLGAAQTSYYFGNPGDKPFAGDFDGDGIDTFGLHRESSGFVYFRNSHTQGIADSQFIYGNPGDILFAGDWDGDGDDTVAVYRPSTGRLYVKLTNTVGVADFDMSIGSYPQVIRAFDG
jgi:subtilisin family serine protease